MTYTCPMCNAWCKVLILELQSVRGIKSYLRKNKLNVELRTWTPWLLAGEISKLGSCFFCLSNGWKYHRINLRTWPHTGWSNEVTDEATDQAEVPRCGRKWVRNPDSWNSKHVKKNFNKMHPSSALMIWWEHNAVRKCVYSVSQWNTLWPYDSSLLTWHMIKSVSDCSDDKKGDQKICWS